MEGGMKAVKLAVLVMGVLILLGTAVIIGTVIRRATSGAPAATAAATAAATGGAPFVALLDEPAGTAIGGIVPVRDLLAVHLRGGGPDRVLLIDPATGATIGRLSLAR